MATIVANTPDLIEFKNVLADTAPPNCPTVTVQAGTWDAGGHSEAGITIDVYGDQAPLLTPADARKLARWLTKAADDLDGVKQTKKAKNKPRHYSDDEEDDNY